jgi:hypothetical protein
MCAQRRIFAQPLFRNFLDIVAGFRQGRDDAVGEAGAQGLAHALAVPACAFGVGLRVLLLVDGGRPAVGRVEGRFGDFVVVVEEFAGFGEGVGVVDAGVELVRVLVPQVLVWWFWFIVMMRRKRWMGE